MYRKTLKPLFTFIFLVNFIPITVSSKSVNPPQPRNFVNYLISDISGWFYKGENQTGDGYVFQNNSQTISITLKKEPVICENSQEFNRLILKTIQDLPKTQEFMEQRKSAVPYPFFGQKNGHLIIVKSRTTNQRRFILNYNIGTEMHQVEISESGTTAEPSGEAVAFIGKIGRGDGKGTPPPPDTPPAPAVQQNQTVQKNQNQAVAVNQTSTGSTIKEGEQQTAQAGPSQNTVQTGKNIPSAGSASLKKKPVPEFEIQVPVTEKGAIPEIKFSFTDPCAPGTDKLGLPWQKSSSQAKTEMPKGIEAAIPPIIPDLKNLSQLNYNSAVSLAFESMRLVYGPMPEDEARKFENVWAPLFDFPTQEIIDYLNKLNPIVSQFLACREAYIRNLNDMQIIMFDAALATEADDQQAWETVMAEAALYAKTLKSLEAAMKSFAAQIDALGNPPNPNEAKCEAQRRYRKFFTQEGPEGCWAGYQDNIFISDGQYNMFQGGENEEKLGLVYNPKFVYIFKATQNGKETYFSIRTCIECNLGMSDLKGNVSSGDFADSFIRENLAGKQTYSGTWIDGPRQGRESQYLQKFEYPNIPEFSKISDEQIRKWIAIDLKENRGLWNDSFQKMLQEKTLAYRFFETALQWTSQNKWQQFNYPSDSWIVPDEVVIAFNNDMMAGIDKEKPKTNQQQMPPKHETADKPVQNDQQKEDEKELQVKQEAIAFHTEMVNIIKRNLERDIADRNEAQNALRTAKTASEAENIARRIKDFDLRIIHHQSNLQAEQDLIDSHKTGQIVRNRTVFDDYAHATFIENIRENAARMDATRRIAERINRQIELLPWEQRAAAREQADRILDAKTVASGDIEKARKFAQAVTNQVQGYAQYDHAMAKIAEVNSEQNEFIAQMAVMAAGAGAVGFGSAALAEAFGAQAAITIYGAKALGAIYGGTTGAIAGGPKEGLKQAVSYWSPYGYAATQFVEGFQMAGYQKDSDMATQIWEGAKQAGTAWFMGKAFEFGAGMVAKGGLMAFGKDSRLFKPVVQTPSQCSKQVLDGLRTQQKMLNAQDEIKTFQTLESNLANLKKDPVANATKIAQLEKELNQLAAGLNMSYYAKWNLKYKADPLTRSKFDRRVQQNYAEMSPGMKKRLEAQGYNLDGIEFKQFRNANSGGTSSMDLDLVPVRAGTTNEPAITINGKKMIRKKDGSLVSLEQFTDDAQKAMNAEYRQQTGLSAPASDMNLVTSVHKEAFATPKLLDHNVDFSTFTADEIASVGKVLQVKMDGINKNQMLTNTGKMQAQCRESAKEIENMLLRKLNSDLQKAPANSPQRKQIESDIRYWEDMLKRFKTIGTDETNPSRIMELNREIMRETGGRDVNGVIKDLQKAFGG